VSITRTKAEETLKALVRHLGLRYEKDAAWTTRFKSGDEAPLDEIVLLACHETGVARSDYEMAFDEFPELRQVQKRMISDVICGPLNSKGCESLGARVPMETRPWWKFW